MSLQFLNAFKFLGKESLIHKLDPRTKFLLAISYTVQSLVFTEVVPLLLIFISLVPVILLGKLLKQWLKSIRGMAILFLIIILLNTWFIPVNGFSFGIAMCLRILIMISAFSIFFLTVDPNQFALSLISMKIPYEFAFSFSLAFRFVPTIALEAQNIIDAQQSRGYEKQKKGLINQIKNLLPLLVPLIISAIKRAFNVAEALESRAFGSNRNRTYYFTINFSLRDYIFTIYLIGFLILALYLRIQFIILPIWLKWGIPL
jgi:energy-coupling factor transport system permease protein